MIEVMQTGQYGKTLSLIDSFKLRKIIFKDRMGWDLNISQDELEIDDYDLPETVYIMVRDEKDRAVGIWRLMPSSSKSMIRTIWPEFLEKFPMPINDQTWEVSRFGVHSYEPNSKDYLKNINITTKKMIAALIDICEMANIQHIYTMYYPEVGRSVAKTGFVAHEISDEYPVDGKPAIIGHFLIDETLRNDVRQKTGIKTNLTYEDLPLILKENSQKIQLKPHFIKEQIYA